MGISASAELKHPEALIFINFLRGSLELAINKTGLGDNYIDKQGAKHKNRKKVNSNVRPNKII